MLFDMAQLTGRERYKLLTSSITPRPIAWVTTLSKTGVLNAAPFSCFNMMGHTPPLVVLGIQQHDDGRYKDTCANIVATGELVVNLVTEADAQAMSLTSADSPPEFDEISAAGLHVMTSSRVRPPRIATAPVSFECKSFQVIRPGPEQTIVLGEVLATHVHDALVLDAERLYLDTPRMRLVGRMHAPGWYARCSDLFQIVPPDPPPA
jgi:flavin reductase (DIM6/NTAB) family NADH-FMN oxidoreductase RutF